MNTKQQAYQQWINGHTGLGWTPTEMVVGLMSEMGATQGDAQDAIVIAKAANTSADL